MSDDPESQPASEGPPEPPPAPPSQPDPQLIAYIEKRDDAPDSAPTKTDD